MTSRIAHREAASTWKVARTAVWVGIWLSLMVAGPWRTYAADTAPITEDNVAERAAAARTPADHKALAAYYTAQAAANAAQVKRHEAMLASYATVAGRSKVIMHDHCKALIQSYREAQKAFEGLAAGEEKLAKAAGGTH